MTESVDDDVVKGVQRVAGGPRCSVGAASRRLTRCMCGLSRPVRVAIVCWSARLPCSWSRWPPRLRSSLLRTSKCRLARVWAASGPSRRTGLEDHASRRAT